MNEANSTSTEPVLLVVEQNRVSVFTITFYFGAATLNGRLKGVFLLYVHCCIHDTSTGVLFKVFTAFVKLPKSHHTQPASTFSLTPNTQQRL